MGEAAEYEIWRRHGVDISDDGYLSNPPRRKPKRRENGYASGQIDRSEYTEQTETVVAEAPVQENTNMVNTREAVALMQLSQGARLIGVKFMAEGFVKPDQKTYTYKVVDAGMQLEIGDLVVVEARDAVAIAQVEQLNVSPSAAHVELGKIRHVVQKIEMAAHRAILDRENQAVERLAMSEVHERLAKFQQQLGSRQFGEVAALLGGNTIKDEAKMSVEVDFLGRLVDVETGEVFGQINGAAGLQGHRGNIYEGRFYLGSTRNYATSHAVHPVSES